MADECFGIDGDGNVTSYSYERPAEPAGDVPAAACAGCGGTGRVQLLVTTRPCETCGGTGKADEPADGHWVTEYGYNDRDELISQTERSVPDERRRDAAGKGEPRSGGG